VPVDWCTKEYPESYKQVSWCPCFSATI